MPSSLYILQLFIKATVIYTAKIRTLTSIAIVKSRKDLKKERDQQIKLGKELRDKIKDTDSNRIKIKSKKQYLTI